MNAKIDNLVKYFVGLFENNDIKGTNFSQMVNKKTIDIKEDDFKKLIVHFLEDKNNNNLHWVNPVDILIMSINSIEKIQKQVNLTTCNKFTILWILCLLNAKYVSSHDYENELSLEFLSNVGGFQLEDYIYFEKFLLRHLDWRLEISTSDYKRLENISENISENSEILAY